MLTAIALLSPICVASDELIFVPFMIFPFASPAVPHHTAMMSPSNLLTACCASVLGRKKAIICLNYNLTPPCRHIISFLLPFRFVFRLF